MQSHGEQHHRFWLENSIFPIRLYLFIYRFNPTIKFNNEIKTTNEKVIAEKQYKTWT